MELGCGTFVYPPKWKGNRKLSADQQASVRMHCLRGLDLFGVEETEEEIRAWAQDALIDGLQLTGRKKEKVEKANVSVLSVLRQVIEHTSDYKNFRVQGEEITDPRAIFCVHLPMPSGVNQDENLLFELFAVLRDTANMMDDELGNYGGPSGGMNTATEKSALPVSEDSGPENADIPQAETEPSELAA